MEDWQKLKLKQNPDKKSVTFFGGILNCEPFRFVGFFFPQGFEGGNGPLVVQEFRKLFRFQQLQT